MENKSLADKLKEIPSRPPLIGKEKEIALKKLNELRRLLYMSDIMLHILYRNIKKVDKKEDYSSLVLPEEYNQIVKEWSSIDNILHREYEEKIKSYLNVEIEENKSGPSDYLPQIENKIINLDDKIREFFTFEKYLKRRMNNLNENYIDYIMNQANKAEAYEFLDIITNQLK
jgi:hypothetical protein